MPAQPPKLDQIALLKLSLAAPETFDWLASSAQAEVERLGGDAAAKLMVAGAMYEVAVALNMAAMNRGRVQAVASLTALGLRNLTNNRCLEMTMPNDRHAPVVGDVLRFYRTVNLVERGGILGHARLYDQGWKFTPNVAGRLPSRKFHRTLERALPRWVGYPDGCESEYV